MTGTVHKRVVVKQAVKVTKRTLDNGSELFRKK